MVEPCCARAPSPEMAVVLRADLFCVPDPWVLGEKGGKGEWMKQRGYERKCGLRSASDGGAFD
jgi:hypothetical protein